MWICHGNVESYLPEFRRVKLKLALSIFLILFTASCSSIYVQNGIDLNDKNSFVTISTDTEKNHRIFKGLDKRVVITSLNGNSLIRIGWDYHYPDVIHVNEGVQIIEVRMNHMNYYADSCLWVDAKLSENYIVRKEIENYSVAFWIANIETGERVGGICGSEPKPIST